jgi:hypothetical protein
MKKSTITIFILFLAFGITTVSAKTHKNKVATNSRDYICRMEHQCVCRSSSSKEERTLSHNNKPLCNEIKPQTVKNFWHFSNSLKTTLKIIVLMLIAVTFLKYIVKSPNHSTKYTKKKKKKQKK